MRTKKELLKRLPEAAQGLAETWRSLRKFAVRLGAEIAGMKRGGQRGFLHNVAILEHWVREALVQLAAHVALPVRRRRKRRAPDDTSPPVDAAETTQPTARRPGFRAILPDQYELEIAARMGKSPAVDISQFAGQGGARGDQRLAYRKRLAAIAGALRDPEMYARRVAQVLEVRRTRQTIKFLPRVTPRSALPDLLRVSRHSDLGRYIWYSDSS